MIELRDEDDLTDERDACLEDVELDWQQKINT